MNHDSYTKTPLHITALQGINDGPNIQNLPILLSPVKFLRILVKRLQMTVH